MYKFIFITGHGRCGTNLIRGFLDGHPKIDVIPGEPRDIYRNVLRYNGLSSKINLKSDTINIISEQISKCYIEEDNYSIVNERIQQLINYLKNSDFDFISANDFLSLVCEKIFKKRNGIACFNIASENIAGVIEAFPNCRVIHLLRNPLTQLNSRYLFRYRIPNNYKSGEFGKAFLGIHTSFFQAYLYDGHDQVFVIRMEDLKKDYKQKVKETCEFLEIDMTNENLILTKLGKRNLRSTANGVPFTSDKIFQSKEDWSCLTPNDLHVCSKMKYVKYFYDIPLYPYKKNSYSIFLLRHLGFIGKNRKMMLNPIKLWKLIIGSIYLYLQDAVAKKSFEFSSNTIYGYKHRL